MHVLNHNQWAMAVLANALISEMFLKNNFYSIIVFINSLAMPIKCPVFEEIKSCSLKVEHQLSHSNFETFKQSHLSSNLSQD